MRKKDQSTEFIKHCLADALIRLMERGEPFDQINVMQICDLAGIGRTTYYRHFDNKSGKANLLRFKIYRKWAAWCEPRLNQVDTYTISALVQFFYEERDLLMLIHRNGLTMSVMFDVLYYAIGPQPEDAKDFAYKRSVLACSIFGILYYWIERNMEDSPEYICEALVMKMDG